MRKYSDILLNLCQAIMHTLILDGNRQKDI